MRKILISWVFFAVLFLPFALPAQVTVISGKGIKPEAGGQKKAPTVSKTHGSKKSSKRRVYTVKKGKDFTVSALQSASSGLSHVGESIYFVADESVPGIRKGTIIRGEIVSLGTSKKDRAVEINFIEGLTYGSNFSVEGNIRALPLKKGKHASIKVGEHFTAQTAKNTLKNSGGLDRPNRKIKVIKDQVFAEIMGKGIKADIEKGKIKGFVFILVEPPKGEGLSYLKEGGPLLLIQVGDKVLPEPLKSSEKIKEGDRNKNSIMDLRFEFPTWDFIKYLPRGNSRVTIQGQLADGSVFQSTLGVEAEY